MTTKTWLTALDEDKKRGRFRVRVTVRIVVIRFVLVSLFVKCSKPRNVHAGYQHYLHIVTQCADLFQMF